MPPGKMAAQAGHAFLEALLTAQKASPANATLYVADPPGTKVVLRAKSLYELERTRYECDRLGIPHALITDSGHVLPPHFTGAPIVTALGFGPATRDEVGRLTRRLALVP
jgi:PTH2 family peptidyl-tRNA hydrolase